MKDSFYLDPRVAAAYDATIEMNDDIPFYVDLAREAAANGERVLELGAGTGRVTIQIAHAAVEVVGLDAAPPMLDVARAKSRGLANLSWVEADMADFALDGRFGLVIITCRSFQLLLTVAEQKSCLAAAREHLLPGGRLALNLFNPSIVMMAEWLTTKRGTLVREKPWPDAGAGRNEQWSTRDYRTASQQIDEQWLEESLSDKGAVISRIYLNLRLRYVFRYEMEHLLDLSGFAVEALYGGFSGQPFGDESTEMVWLARKRT
jgi:ubiquinone/menaquinone biosynthesis C-methylase UbiE